MRLILDIGGGSIDQRNLKERADIMIYTTVYDEGTGDRQGGCV